jgi:hypothetical protein
MYTLAPTPAAKPTPTNTQTLKPTPTSTSWTTLKPTHPPAPVPLPICTAYHLLLHICTPPHTVEYTICTNTNHLHYEYAYTCMFTCTNRFTWSSALLHPCSPAPLHLLHPFIPASPCISAPLQPCTSIAPHPYTLH